ncbi:MAG TPA: hypothetical protein VF522_18975 [Ramlibacter sp.]|uniref:hypothetical protein n=1 Tax=Ramlibacter sp. TaxID=1917967 RepID=UPI002ED413AF
MTFTRINDITFTAAADAVLAGWRPQSQFSAEENRVFCAACQRNEIVVFPGVSSLFVVVVRQWELGSNYEKITVLLDLVPQQPALQVV